MSAHKRHIAKTITWRLVGTLDTIMLSWIITGNALTGLKIGGTEKLMPSKYVNKSKLNFLFEVNSSGPLDVFKYRFKGALDKIFTT